MAKVIVLGFPVLVKGQSSARIRIGGVRPTLHGQGGGMDMTFLSFLAYICFGLLCFLLFNAAPMFFAWDDKRMQREAQKRFLDSPGYWQHIEYLEGKIRQMELQNTQGGTREA